MEYAIESTALVKRYGARRALDGLTLSVPRFAVLGLVGPNGAGKTTWMMSVAGLLHLHGGTMNLLGGGPFDPAVHSGRVTLLPQDSELPLESRPIDLLTHYGLLQGLTRREAERSASTMLQEVHLGDRLTATVRSLSHGMRKRVMIAQCFIGFPELVLLDEPLSGLDPRETAHMRAFLPRRRGRQTLVISSHNLHDIEVMCDRVAFIEKGRTVRNTTLDEMIGASSMLLYRVTTGPSDLASISAAVPGIALSFDAATCTVCCRYEPKRDTPAQINARVLPLLLAQCGLIDIARGDSLEAAYLRTSGAP